MTRHLVNPSQPKAVYIHYDEKGACLYVGCSAAPLVRTKGHSSAAPWFRSVARIEIQWCDDTPTALDREMELIRTLRPPFNRRLSGQGVRKAMAQPVREAVG